MSNHHAPLPTFPALPAQRLPDWPARLEAAFRHALPQPFAWGALDCVLFAADAVHACTGVDPVQTWRGGYNRAQALRTLRRLGGLRHAAGLALGGTVPLQRALPGDVGLTRCAGRPLLAVCTTSGWFAPSRLGLVLVDDPHTVWGVGHG